MEKQCQPGLWEKVNTVLDHGYVRLVDVMGSDLSVVNAARVSYDKQKIEMDDGDVKLLNYLVKNYHDSPLRHATMTLEIYAPLMIARQVWKHVVNSTFIDDSEGWNEQSFRYTSDGFDFYSPEWRGKAETNKQGSSGTIPHLEAVTATEDLLAHYDASMALYDKALSNGIAPELARLYLPSFGLYTRFRWTASLNALLNFLSLRLGHGAQYEIIEYAKAIGFILEDGFPVTMKAWNSHRTEI